MAMQFNNYQPKHYISTNAQWEVLIHGTTGSFTWHVVPLVNGESLEGSKMFESFEECVKDCECYVPHFQTFGN